MKWDYKTFAYNKRNFFGGNVNVDELTEKLNKLGNEGWELVSVSAERAWGGQGIVVIMKRPRP